MANSAVSSQVQALLKPVEPALAEAYFAQVTHDLGAHLQVRETADQKGRGVFTTQACKADDLVFKERPLVGAQHTANKADALVCSACFSMIGSIEQQIAHRLLAREENGGQAINRDYLRGLFNGAVQLPCTEKFPLPKLETCLGGCTDNVYCSSTCAEADWASCHSLLCSGPPPKCTEWSRDQTAGGGSSSSSAQQPDSSRPRMSFDDFKLAREAQRAPGLSSMAPAMLVVPPNIGRADAVRAFKAHADSTNDIFHIAAQVIARVILQASKAAVSVSMPGEVAAREATPQENWAALQEAWKPFSVAWKAPWWESAATPEDMTPEAFSAELRGLAEESLTLLKEFLLDERFPALFDLEVYGSIIGMFELNNLSLYVASPVEDYVMVCTVDTGGFEPAEQHMAHLLSRPLLDGLGDSYDAACEGSCFYALQSCLNHSCAPNAHAFKRKGVDTDGSAVILAKQDIAAGEEVLLSYTDESVSYHERQAALRDYGFICACARCTAEAAPAGKAKV